MHQKQKGQNGHMLAAFCSSPIQRCDAEAGSRGHQQLVQPALALNLLIDHGMAGKSLINVLAAFWVFV